MSAYSELYPVVPNGNITIEWEALLDEDADSYDTAITIANARTVNSTNSFTEIDVSVLSDTLKHFALGLKDDSFSIEVIGGLRGLTVGDIGKLTITYAEGEVSAEGKFAVASSPMTWANDTVISSTARFIRYRGKQ